MTRATWATRLGFILAAVGSAVGLGNIWRFPWMTAQNGGSAFLAVYLGVVLVVGVPGLLAEFVLGRRSRKTPVGAFRDLGGPRWAAVGALGVVTSLVLLSFYSVVGGWILRYLVESLRGLVTAGPAYATEPAAYFGTVASGVDAVAFHLLFLALTAAVVFAGVRRGIEVGTTLMMPAVLLLLVALAAWAGTRPGAGAGYAFLLDFDLASLRTNVWSVLPAAAGQALFTLSLGAGTMLTYASYLGEDRSLAFDGTVIAALNTFVGVLTGLVVFPLLFSLGVDPATTQPGPGALFVGLVGAFTDLPGGELVATAFFGVVTLAALSSAISMLELPVGVAIDELGVSRPRAVGGYVALLAVTGSVLGLDQSLFGVVAGPVVDTLLTLGLALTLLFAGWVVGSDALAEYRQGAGRLARRLAWPWLLVVGAVLPLFLVFTLLTSLGGALSAPLAGGLTLAVVAVSVGLLRRPSSVV